MKSLGKAFRNGLLIACTAFIYGLGCSSSDNPTSPDDNIDPGDQQSERADVASKAGVDIYRNLSSFNQIEELLSGPDDIVELDIPDIQDRSSAMKFSNKMKAKSLAILKRYPDVTSRLQQQANGDSVVFDVTERNDQEGVTYRVSLIYNRETGQARLFVVGFDYLEGHTLSYDSTEIKVDLNFTIFDESDDVLLSLENLKRFQPGQLIAEQMGKFIPDEHEAGSEPTGGILTNDITYSNSSFISKTSARFEYHEDVGGSYEKTSDFSDGSRHTEMATFNVDGTGTFSESRRDGTTLEGTFDSAEQDGQGGYSLTITFPAGHDPVSVSESGEFTFDAGDSTIDGSFEREVRLLDGTVERESVSLQQTRVGDVLTSTLNIENTDGSHGFIAITETPDVNQVNGEWNNADETFVVFTAQGYPDDSAHLEFQLYASEVAFENGDEPIATGVFDFYPDGSGRGVVTEGEDVYDVVINPDGSVVITKRS